MGLPCRSAIKANTAASIQGVLATNVQPALSRFTATSTSAPTSTPDLQAAVAQVRQIADHWSSLQAPDPALQTSDGAEQPTVNLQAVRGLWGDLVATLFSAYSPVTAADLEAACSAPGLVYHMNQLAELTTLLDSLQQRVQM